MNFYQNIAGYYHHIFPLNKNQVDFVKTACPDASGSSVLEVGCATGSLVIALSEIFDKVTGIDLDEAMLQKARHAVGNGINNVHLLPLNMLAIKNTFGTNAFDAIVCFGNTLVHLADEQQIFDFFIQARKALRPRGKLLLQIIYYDRIIDRKIDRLPTIENDIIRFERNYTYRMADNRIDFATRLTIKADNRQLENLITLYPVRKAAIGQLLQKAGFRNISYWGSFQCDPLTADSIPLIVETG